MRLALISLDQHWQDKDSNFARCVELVLLASSQQCKLAIFPEMTLTGYSLQMDSLVESIDDSVTLRRFGELARSAAIDIIFGACLYSVATGRPQNTLCHASRDGRVRCVYSKMHPFSFAGEDDVFEAGNSLGVIAVDGVNLGCSICYDLRFPEPFSLMAQGCHAIVNIANWPAKRLMHWEALLTARAIENQLFLFGVNRIGVDGNNLKYEESSMVVAPGGSKVKPIWSDHEVSMYEIDPVEVERHREIFPTINDKRYDLYRSFYGNN